MSKYGVFSDPYFPVFGLNTEIYSVNHRIQSEYRKIRTRKNAVFGHFSRSVPDDKPNIFQKSNINCYVEKPTTIFCNRKNSDLNDFCYAEFLTFENKSSKTCKYITFCDLKWFMERYWFKIGRNIQLLSVRGKLPYSQFSDKNRMKDLLGL